MTSDGSEPEVPQRASSVQRARMPIANLPSASDQKARWWRRLAIATYVGLVVVLVGSMVSSGGVMELAGLVGISTNPAGNKDVSWAITVMVFISVSITVFVFWHTVREVQFLEVEESDLSWWLTNRDAAVPLDPILVLVPPRQRSTFQSPNAVIPAASLRNETMLAERVRGLIDAVRRRDGSRPQREHLRATAESRLFARGQDSRYAASLLLLLTVLGTFTGIKTALPKLIAAANVSDVTALGEPLKAVGQAFGSNSLALIGAIALGLLSFGYSTAYVAFLERLELVTDDITAGTESGESALPLEAATHALKDGVEGLRETQHIFEDVATAIQGLEQTTEKSFTGLRDALAELASRSDDEFSSRSAKLFDSLEQRLGRLEDAVISTADAYTAVVSEASQRGADSRNALDELKRANEILGTSLIRSTSVGEAVDKASGATATASLQLRESAVEIGTAVAQLSAETTQLRTEIAALRRRSGEGLETQIGLLARSIQTMTTGRQADDSSAQLGQVNVTLLRVAALLQADRSSTGKDPSTDRSAELIGELRSLASLFRSEARNLRARMWVFLVLLLVSVFAFSYPYIGFRR